MELIEVKIIQDTRAPLDLAFCASSDGGTGDNIYAGYGKTPYEALHELINEFFLAEIWRPD